MKLIHLSDLHLGKRVNEFSMLEDQQFILREILRVIDEESPQAVLIAGDIYDKSMPSAEAVTLFDDFLVRLAGRGLEVFVISGNHDSAERLAFGNLLMEGSGIHIASAYSGVLSPCYLSDPYGRVAVCLLPFVKPAHVRRFFPEEEITDSTQALKTALNGLQLDPADRNILVAHQFVTGAERSDSEEISVGGAENVDAAVFDGFDYVALGHLHGPQNVGSERIRYCGTPLKYSFSEANHQKSVTVAELRENGDLSVRTIPLKPCRDMVELRGTYEELMRKSFYEGTGWQEDYVHITLTDEEDVMDAVQKLRRVYRNMMKLDYDNTRTRHSGILTEIEEAENRQPIELFADFYEQQNGQPLTEIQRSFVGELIEKVLEEER